MALTETLTSTSPDIASVARSVSVKGGGALGSSLTGLRNTKWFILDTSAAAYTLALPVAGVDDGKSVEVVDTTGHAHTVTTPADGINGASDTGTFGGTVGTTFTLRAFGGKWYAAPGTGNGVTLSEV